jgi:hypothetical protein
MQKFGVRPSQTISVEPGLAKNSTPDPRNRLLQRSRLLHDAQRALLLRYHQQSIYRNGAIR